MIPENYKKALIEELDGEALENMSVAIESNTFYAVGIDTMCGGISLGLIETTELDIPCLFATLDEAKESIDDEIERYLEEVQEGSREEEDTVEGALHIVRWSDDGKTLNIYDEKGVNLLENKTAIDAANG